MLLAKSIIKFFHFLNKYLPDNFSADYSFYILKFNLIENAVNMDLIKYSTFCYFFERNNLNSLFSYIFDKNIEISVISKTIDILEKYKISKFEHSSLNDDYLLLQKIKGEIDCNFRNKFYLLYRLANKEILLRQLNLFKLLLRILSDGYEIGMNKYYDELEDENSFLINRSILNQYFEYRTIKL